jgi:hypothetical protein
VLLIESPDDCAATDVAFRSGNAMATTIATAKTLDLITRMLQPPMEAGRTHELRPKATRG